MYVALGDSMSIDDHAGGAGWGAASLLHRNRDADFPAWAGRDLASAGLTGSVLAWDGATAADVLQCQLPLITEPPAVVTITMGGNDLLMAWGDDAAARAAIGQVIAAGEVILARLGAAGGTGRIVISTVYDPSDGTGRLGAGELLMSWPGGLAALGELNAALAGLAARHGAAVADVHARFLGHGVTAGDPSQLLSMPASRDLWYCGSIEPNAWGADQIRQTWWDALHTQARASFQAGSEPGHLARGALCRRHQVSRWRRADRGAAGPPGAGAAGRGRDDRGRRGRPGGRQAVPGIPDVGEPVAAGAGIRRPGGAGFQGRGRSPVQADRGPAG